MSKFNQALQKIKNAVTGGGPNVFNRAGGPAFQDAPRLALYRQVAASLWAGDGYYERQAEWFARFQQNVTAALAEDPRFPFALAAYARDQRGLGLRTSPLALYVEAAANPLSKGTGLVRRYAPKILRRADEPAEAIAYFRAHYLGVIPHGLLRGIKDTLRGFDEYQLAKYSRSGAVLMRDVLRLARPKPQSDEERSLWGRAVTRTLATPYTWEVELSQATSVEAKREKWNELIRSGKLGLFALVRNLRNIIQCGADVEEALSGLTPERVKGTGILPFQWYKAYKAVQSACGETLAEPLERALEWSLADLPRLPGVTLVACDNSGSMSTVSQTRGLSNAELANLMGALALYGCEAGLAGTFGDEFALAQVNPRHDLFYNKRAIDQCGRTTGNSTNAWKVFAYLIRENIRVDRVVLFSDMQCYDRNSRFVANALTTRSLAAELEAYGKINPAVTVYSVNLATQDNSCQFAPGQRVVELAGFSASVFQFIQAMEVGDNILDHILENY